jgi:hypothetical protein
MAGSKRKGNLEYMVEKYGELEGQKKFEEYLSRHKDAYSKASGKNSSSLKRVYTSCPLYAALNKEVNQPKGANLSQAQKWNHLSRRSFKKIPGNREEKGYIITRITGVEKYT